MFGLKKKKNPSELGISSNIREHEIKTHLTY